MKRILLLAALLLPIQMYPQLDESFSGEDITSANPWEGDLDKFEINASGQLQFISPAGEAGSASLRLPLPYREDMTWEIDAKLNFKSTDANNLRIYVYAAGADTFYVQAGNNTRRVSLYEKEGNTAKPCITGRKALLDEPYAFVSIRLTLEEGKVWTLYTRKAGESDFYREGSCKKASPPDAPQAPVMLVCRYIKGRISEYLIDNLKVTHGITEMPEPEPEPEPADSAEVELLLVETLNESELQFFFDKPVDISGAVCEIEEVGEAALSYGQNQSIVNVRFPEPLENGREYVIAVEGLSDLEGRKIPEQAWAIRYDEDEEEEKPPLPPSAPGEPEDPVPDVEPGEVVFNELLPNPFAGGSEYIELYNRSHRALSLTGLVLASLKTDGSLNTPYPLSGVSVPVESEGYVLLTKDREAVASFYLLSSPEAVYEMKLPVLANASSALVLFRVHDGVIIDEVAYSSQWHDASVKDPKGVALERIDPDGKTQDAGNWTSAATTAGYGTPGYRNSQFGAGSGDTPTGISAPALMEDGLYRIAYYLAAPGYRCRIRIYNMAGAQVAEAANHELPGTSGEFIWDGKSSAGNRLPTGVYILLAELYNTNGMRKEEKKVFLVR
ncbi:MAG: hypothetical protein LBQ73_04515 [Tannerellaceae bacterium]|jgi:hypothetical protein|nr:hypothetical protein [Tannerellaceae bacterium]